MKERQVCVDLPKGRFDGRTVVITGGGSGIGRCTAHELASLGAKVLITGRNVDKLERTAAEIRQDGASVGAKVHYVFDVRDAELGRWAMAAMLADHGVIDGLVNNAGGQYPMPLESIGKKGWDAVLASNLTGGFLVARAGFMSRLLVQEPTRKDSALKSVLLALDISVLTDHSDTAPVSCDASCFART
ncbi:hypothetical protein A4G29_20045 [Mycobacterium kansasii]|nr:hypothetical protein A4G29_20045 [Mycobacterium kansasii]